MTAPQETPDATQAGHGEKKSRRGEAAISALLTEATVGRAAAKAGVSERTLRRWLKNPKFLKAYRRARMAVVEGAIGSLTGLTDEAVEALRDCVVKGNEPAVRLRAATAIFDRVLDSRRVASQTAELEDLIAEVEQMRDVDPE